MPAARRERHVGRDTQVRKQQRLLQQHADPPGVGRHEHAGRRVGQHTVAEPNNATVGPHQAGDHVQRRGLARAVGAKDRQHFACGDSEFDVDGAIGDHRPQVHVGHAALPTIVAPVRSLRAPSPSTTTAATATNNTDSATAASASVSRCR